MKLIRMAASLAVLSLLPGCQKKEAAVAAPKAPLRIAYSDWPGWTAFEIAIQKGWFKEAGVDVQFSWFEYAPSMDAFTAGKVDAVTIASGDALVTGAQGGKSVAVLVTDYSNGNDMIVAKPGIKTLKDLKGKKVGIEIGLVEHLLLTKGLQTLGMKESDVQLVGTPTNQTAQVLATGDVAAIGAWQPNAGQALKALPDPRPSTPAPTSPDSSTTSFPSRRRAWPSAATTG
jgi:NitT/TauT family transport system substrate-binding protein